MAKKILVKENIDPTKGAELLRAYKAKLEAQGMQIGSTTTERFEDGTGQLVIEVITPDLNKADNLGKDEGMLEGSNYDFEHSPNPVTKKTISVVAV